MHILEPEIGSTSSIAVTAERALNSAVRMGQVASARSLSGRVSVHNCC